MKVSTGIKNLDVIMDGGFIDKSFNLVYGGGGTGKTLFTFNFLLNGAEQGNNVLYITLEESWDDITRKLPDGMRKRLDAIRDKFHYLDFGSLRPVLGREIMEVNVLTEAIASSIVVNNVSLVGFDGIAPLSIYYEDEHKLRSVIFNLSQSIKSYGATTVFTSEEIDGRSRYGTEEFVADSVIRLTYNGTKRRLQILKTRGTGFVGGKHGLEISSSGLRVYPKLLFPEGKAKPMPESMGILKLDNMLGETFSGDITLITGPPGTGKYLFGLSFLKNACKHGKNGLYISFEENIEKIKRRLDDLGDSRKLCKVIYIDPKNEDIYKILWQLRALTKDTNRLVLHGMNMLSTSEEYEDFIHAFLGYMRARGISTMLTYSTTQIIATNTLGDEQIVNRADNIIKLLFAEIGGELKKILVIIKSHSPTHERGLVEYRLGKRGVVIVGKIEGMEGVMSGTPTKQMEIKKRVESFFK